MVEIIDNFDEPFVILKIGYEDYEGEEDLWEDDEQDVTHILVRAIEELEVVKEAGKLDFYPFGLGRSWKETIEKLEDIWSGSIDIFFVANIEDRDGWIDGFPDPDQIIWDEVPDSLRLSSLLSCQSTLEYYKYNKNPKNPS